MLQLLALRTWSSLPILFVFLLLIGCGGGTRARAVVKGKVTIDGKALTVGTVMFHGKNNAFGTAKIDVNGDYVMNDAPLGEVAITVSVPKAPPGGIENMKSGPAAKAMLDKASVDPEGSGKSIPIMGTMPSKIVPIPAKYAEATTSGLTYTVERGEHSHDLPLTP